MNTLIKKQLFDGKFEIQGEIAHGQTGTVLNGYDLGLRQEVAIKIYHSHINGQLIRGKAFIEKSQPLLRLDHPNLIKIFKVEEEDDTPVIFMEFFDAPNLQQIIHDKGPMPVQDMLMRAREITEVLVHIHFQGIIHGTLHPGHVLVNSQGQVKVTDLGLSWILMDILANCDPELLRPLPYFPPEIAKGELLNISSDLYCLGFMMYEMLTGTTPYAGLPKTSIMGKLAFDQADPALDFPDPVPKAVCDLIRQMTRNKANQRLQDATHALTIINQQLDKLPLSKESAVLPSIPSQPKALPQETPTGPEKTAKASAPSTTPEPALKKTPPFQRTKTSMNYRRVRRVKTLRKLGVFFGIALLIAGGVMGFWYRGWLEPSTHTPLPDLSSSPQSPSLPQTISVEGERSLVPAQDSMNVPGPLSEIELAPMAEPTSLSPESSLQPDQSNSTEPPHFPKTKQGKALVPTKKQSDATPAPAPGKPQPAVSTSAGSKNTPLPPKASKEISRQQPISFTPTKETIHPETESAQSFTRSKEIKDELTDEKIEELLQSFDAPAADVPSLTEPQSFLNR